MGGDRISDGKDKSGKDSGGGGADWGDFSGDLPAQPTDATGLSPVSNLAPFMPTSSWTPNPALANAALTHLSGPVQSMQPYVTKSCT